MTYNFERVPNEFKSLNQWVLWVYRTIDGRETKVPLNRNGIDADATDPANWLDFATAVEIANRERVGIGFSLTAEDPFVCIDLDDPTKHGWQQDEVQRIYRLGTNIIQDMNSYTEISPSGNGLHIWVKAELPAKGVKSSADCLEIYSTKRYITFTGWSYHEQPLPVEKRPEVSAIYDALARYEKPLAEVVEQPCDESVEAIIQRIKGWRNGDTFWSLFNTTDEQAGSNKSEIDQGLMNFIVQATKNIEASKAVFRASERGKREKAERDDYLDRTIRRAFDKIDGRPLISIETLLVVGKEQLQRQREHEAARARYQAEGKAFVPTQTELAMYPNPGGLLGHIAEAIYASSYKPRWTVALAGAMAFMAGVCARGWNVAGVGLNHYIVALAPTAYGKDAALKGPGKLVNWLSKEYPAARGFIGPKFASPQAMLKHFDKQPSFVSFIDEFGETFLKWGQPERYPNQGAFVSPILELYASAAFGSVMPEVLHSGTKSDSTKLVLSPSYSFVGVSVPSTFFEALDPKMGNKGMASRLTIIVCPDSPETFNDESHHYEPPRWLMDQLKTLVSQSVMINNSMNLTGVRPVEIGWGVDVVRRWTEFRQWCANERRKYVGNETMSQLFDRSPEKAKRLAGLVAVGYAPLSPVVTLANLDWAITFTKSELSALIAKFEAGEVGVQDNETARFNDLYKWVQRWFLETTNDQLIVKDSRFPLMRAHNMIPRSWLFDNLRKLAAFRTYRDGPVTGLDRLITSLSRQSVISLKSKPVQIGPDRNNVYDGDVISILNNESFGLKD